MPSQGSQPSAGRTTDDVRACALRITSPHDLEARYCRNATRSGSAISTTSPRPVGGAARSQLPRCSPPCDHAGLYDGTGDRTGLSHTGSAARAPSCSIAAMWMPTSWSRRSANTQVDVVRPPFGSYGWQHQIGQGHGPLGLCHRLGGRTGALSLRADQVSNGRQAGMCPVIPSCASGLTGPPVACPTRQVCTTAKDAPATHRPPTSPLPRRSKPPANARNASTKAQYALRSGVESSLRRHPALSSPSESLHRQARTHFQ